MIRARELLAKNDGRIPLRQALLTACLTCLVVACGGSDQDPRSNVVMVVVDTLRADHLDDYGYERATMGPMRQLSLESTRYSRCYAPSSWTRPSVATIFSGLMPARHQAKISGTNRLNTAIPTLAEVLRDAGWSTAGFSANVVVSKKVDFDQGFETFVDYEGGVLGYPDIERLLSLARSWLFKVDEPFFLYFQPMNVHGPYRYPPEYRRLLLDRAPSTEFEYLKPPRSELMKGALHLRSELSESYRQSLDDQYDTSIRYSMEMLGKLFDDLREAGRWDNTLVILTADHGEELFDHGGQGHGYSLYGEVLHVPLYIKLPGQSEGRTRDEVASLVDLYPTVLDALGLLRAEHLDGRSLLDAGDVGRDLVFETNNAERFKGRAIISDGYKLIERKSSYESYEPKIELYDLTADPGERIDLAAIEPERVAELLERMNSAFARYAERALPVPQEGDADLDQETLRALGYVN